MATTAARTHRPPAGGADAAVALVKQRFAGARDTQIDLLAAELLQSGGLGTGCLVYGPPATGKTAIVRSLLRALGVRHVYVNCPESPRPRALLASVLQQLRGGKRMRESGYDCGVKCDSMADFRLHLPDALGRRGDRAWLVLDNAHRLAGGELLAGLMRAREDAGAEVALLLVGTAPWASGRYLHGTAAELPPKEVAFAAYRPGQLQQIVEYRRRLAQVDSGDLPAFKQFLNAFVPAFCRASNNLLDLEAAVAHLFPLYMQPLREGQQLQAVSLYGRIKEQVQECLRSLALQQGAAAPMAADGVGGEGLADSAAAGGAAGRRACSSGLAFELPYISKFLLLAAYIASRNKPTADRAVFDPTFRKRGRRDAQAHDRQVEAAVEAKLRGPHAFPLERLLQIFHAIYADHDADDEEEEGGQDLEETHRVMQQAEVLQQVSSLVLLRLLEQVSGDVLEGQSYRCNLGDDAATRLADNVRLRLTDYLKLA
ncbi:origin recognition complex subunit 5-like [Chlorella sorokiniana]|uniref:Origin recognition complex subunit 5-like n=1 Tax=Chlorella sorokiniana TaxID=3076 RepID=A0A2P6TBV9_CHLSO|nr:origin recognition complex subunit 5-like [Chlorella sorokiniana]|eukprot:PRW18369.1 origin recognition complex subunit 5-like [Chlorella sorokiniana]